MGLLHMACSTPLSLQAFIPFIAALAFIGLAFMTFFIAVFIGKAMAGNAKASAAGSTRRGLGRRAGSPNFEAASVVRFETLLHSILS